MLFGRLLVENRATAESCVRLGGVLPAAFDGTFSLDVAAVFGVGLKTLYRLRKAGLAVRVGTDWRLEQPVDEARVALEAVGGSAALATVSAADRYGWKLLLEPDAMHVVVPPWKRPVAWPCVRVHRWALADSDTVEDDGLRLTSPTRTALDVARTRPLAEALVMLDELVGRGVLDQDVLREAAGTASHQPGGRRVAAALSLANGERASPPESVFRALVHQARLPEPVDQYRVVVGGREVARADFAWPQHRLIVEIDGYAYHSATGAFTRDRQRQNVLVLAGWRVLRFTAVDVLNRPTEVLHEVRRALAA